MASCDVGFQNGDFIFQVVGARGQGFVVLADSLGVLRGLEEGVGSGFLRMGFGEENLAEMHEI